MPTRAKQLAENALMLGISLVLLFLGVYTILGSLALLVAPVPFVLLAVQRTVRELAFILVAYILLGFLLTGVSGGLLAFFLGLIGCVMGIIYQKKKSAVIAIVGGAVVVLVSLIFGLAFTKLVIGFDIIGELKKTGDQLVSGQMPFPTPSWMSSEDWKNQIKWQIELFQMVMPSMLVVMSFFVSGVVHWFSRLIASRMGKPVPRLKPLREWNFPRSLIYYYFGALLILLLFGTSLDKTFLGNALNNLKVLLDMIFILQGLSFCLFAFHLKGWKKLTPVLIVSLFIFPLLTYILSLLGILDLGIGLRKRLEMRK